MLFSKRLKSLRDSRNMSQKEFASFLEINPVTLSHYENEKREPDLNRLVSICTKLNVTSDYLLGLSNSVQSQPPFNNERKQTPNAIPSIDLLHSFAPRYNTDFFDKDLQDRFTGYFEGLLDEQNARNAAKSKEA